MKDGIATVWRRSGTEWRAAKLVFDGPVSVRAIWAYASLWNVLYERLLLERDKLSVDSFLGVECKLVDYRNGPCCSSSSRRRETVQGEYRWKMGRDCQQWGVLINCLCVHNFLKKCGICYSKITCVLLRVGVCLLVKLSHIDKIFIFLWMFHNYRGRCSTLVWYNRHVGTQRITASILSIVLFRALFLSINFLPRRSLISIQDRNRPKIESPQVWQTVDDAHSVAFHFLYGITM